MPKYGLDPFEYRKEWAEEYGDLVHIDGGVARDGYLVTSRELFEQILVTDDEKYERPREYTDVFGQSIGGTEGEFWRKQRDLIQPAFFPDRVKTYSDRIRDSAATVASGWADGETVEISDEMKDLTLDVFVRTIFGLEDTEQYPAIREACEAISEKSAAKNQVFPQWFPTGANRRYWSASEDLNDAIDEIITSCRQSDTDEETLLATLMEAEADDGHQMSDEVLRNELIALLFAGHETTALSLTYTWFLLSKNPEKRSKLLTEVDEVLGDEPVSPRHAPQLQYTENVIKESLRVLCPAHSIFRKPQEPVTVNGYEISEDAAIFLPIWLLHHDEEYYDDPLEFRPERWEDGLEQDLPKYAYIPFGAGPHRCVGEMFAKMELRMIVPTIAQQRRVDLVEPERELEFKASLTALPKDGIEMEVTARD
jgi:cytochrome P450